ncbi:MAG: hypothetical protein U0470_09605 [Anaerolineae bacterium]
MTPSRPPDGLDGWCPGGVGLVWLTGADRLPFLHRMSTNRVADLAPGQRRSTVLVSDAGRVVDWVACYHSADGTALVTSDPAAAAAVTAHLARYTLRDDVRVTNATGQVVVRRVFGARATALVEALLGPMPGAPDRGFIEHGEGDTTIWALRHASPWPDSGWDIVVPSAASDAAFSRACAAARVGQLSAAAYASGRIRHVVPRFGAEIDGTTNPLELGLFELIDFNKGCYIGQEIVARLDTYQKVSRRLVALRGDAPLSIGDIVHPRGVAPTSRRRDGQGRVTSVAPAEIGGSALAIVPSAWLAGDSRELVVGDDQPVWVIAPGER